MTPSDGAQNTKRAAVGCCPVVELRQYTLHPGKRDALVELFEREFIESQEALGISVIGQFRDLDDPERFVWLRGFQDMEARRAALAAFYGGPVWEAHRETANATMLASDNTLLLRPVGPDGGFAPSERRASDTPDDRGTQSVVVATIHYLDAAATGAFAAFFKAVIAHRLVAAGGSVLAVMTTESSANTFPRLPVREGEHVFVWFSAFPEPNTLERHRAALRQPSDWRGSASAEVLRQLMRKPEVLVLAPTHRSLLR